MKGSSTIKYCPDYFQKEVFNVDLNEHFYFDHHYKNILGQGFFSEVRKLKNRIDG